MKYCCKSGDPDRILKFASRIPYGLFTVSRRMVGLPSTAWVWYVPDLGTTQESAHSWLTSVPLVHLLQRVCNPVRP